MLEILLQIPNTPINSTAVYEKALDAVAKANDANNNGVEKLSLILLITTVMNIVIVGFNTIGQLMVKKSEIKVFRKNKIEEKRLAIIEATYNRLDSLTLIDPTRGDLILQLVQEVNLYISQNRLFIGKELEKAIRNFLDYYLTVAGDVRRKNISTELELLEIIISIING